MHEITAQELIQEVKNHGRLMTLHIQALACHCECLGMNAENAISCCENSKPPFNNDDYEKVMQKWGLVDEEGNPII